MYIVSIHIFSTTVQRGFSAEGSGRIMAKPDLCVWTGVLQALPWSGTLSSYARSRVSKHPCPPPGHTGGFGLFCSSKQAVPPAPSRCSWRLPAAARVGVAVLQWRCCCTRHRWSKGQSCKYAEYYQFRSEPQGIFGAIWSLPGVRKVVNSEFIFG